ncbi:hypothetical protein F2P56_014895 [Juglans regia]|uniref:Importin beta-like SAD2 homolog isoform X1 n=2 Tax=Juglans regia TaxID=51240 RepID=A0A2I4FQE8_JUGRE|nr:importin beta-like SAD2 homolog isoform X1 [Juglans regia]KAF5464846.1 hypothetical protein F2P56_014895 [Juglans regia]
MEVAQIAHLLSETLSPDGHVVRTASEALDRLSQLPGFPFSLLSIATGGENHGRKVAAATYLKNFTRRSINEDGTLSSKVSKEFKDQLMRALLQVEPAVLKVLIEAFRAIVVAEFMKQNSWPELVPDLLAAIQNSNLFSNTADCKWNTINSLTVLHALLRPFQYFLNSKVAKEPVPPQLEQIAKEVLVPLIAVFHHLVEKALAIHDRTEMEMEKILLTVCKCIYFAVRSHMPSALAPLLPSFCRDLIAILGSLSFECSVTIEDGYLMRLKTGKRSLLIFCAFISRHRKYSDKLMPDIINCVLNIVKYSKKTSELNFLSERIVSLAFDVISHVLETGPGWRLVSPHFTFLLDSAIFPALVLNEKDISEWEEDAEEYIRKNLPSDLEEISGWREDLFTARKSAMNLLGVISMSTVTTQYSSINVFEPSLLTSSVVYVFCLVPQGPPIGNSSNGSSTASKRKKSEKNKRYSQRRFMGELFVLPFLSKFPIPSDANASQPKILNDYFGVLMAYGGLQDFLRVQEPGYISTLVYNRVLPLYTISACLPYLLATANWVLGELAPCLREEMSADVYSSLLKALAMPDKGDTSCYPVRVSAAGAIAALLENDYAPPEWLPLLEVVIGRIGNGDEESSLLFQLLSSIVEAVDENVAVHIPYIVSALVGTITKLIPANPEPWPQVVERGFAALAVMAQSWENLLPEEIEQNELSEKWTSGRATIGRAFSALLQHAWLSPMYQSDREGEGSNTASCIDDSSTLLLSIMLSVSGSNVLLELKVSELLLVWANLIADCYAWDESENLSIFDCIKDVVNLHSKYGLKNFLVGRMLSPPAPPVPQRSIIEGIGGFVSEAISQYPSATWRACSCVHILLHVPSYSFDADGVKQSLVIAFSRAAFCRFREIRSNPCSLWKPLLVAIASCYLCYPDVVEEILEKGECGGFTIWASALGFLLTSSYESGLSEKSEIKLIVIALAQVVEQLGLRKPSSGVLRDCFTSLLEASARLKEVQEEKEEAEQDDEEDDDDDDDETSDYDEESEPEEQEETEEEFLDRYAKAAVALENGTVIEEGDVEDQEHETELGSLEEVDERKVVLSLIEKYHHALIQGQTLPLELISRFLNAYPECSLYFQ